MNSAFTEAEIKGHIAVYKRKFDSSFTKVAFPFVRRVFSNLLAKELVSVQPMKIPAGLFYLNTSTSKPNK